MKNFYLNTLIILVLTGCVFIKEPTYSDIMTAIKYSDGNKLTSLIDYYNKREIKFSKEYDNEKLLIEATKYENFEVIEILLNTFPNKNIYKSYGFISLVSNIEKNSINKTNKELIYKNLKISENILYQNYLKSYEANYINVFKELLEIQQLLDIDNNVNKSQIITILEDIVKQNNEEMFLFIYENFNLDGEELSTIFKYIIEQENKDMFILIKNSFKLNWEKILPKYWSDLSEKSIDFIDFIYKETNLDINYIDNNGNVFISSILYNQKSDNIIKYINHFISKGADPAVDDFVISFLKSRFGSKDKEVVNNIYNILVKYNFNFNKINVYTEIPYIFYSLRSNVAFEYYPGQKIMFNLLKDKVDLTVTMPSGATLVHFAVSIGELSILKDLIENYGLSIEQKDNNGVLPIYDLLSPHSFSEPLFKYILSISDDTSFLNDPEFREGLLNFLHEEKVNELLNDY